MIWLVSESTFICSEKLTFRNPDLEKPLPPILHYSSPAPALTKYDMTCIIAKHLNLPIDHVIKDTTVPTGATPRPENTQLSTKVLEELGIDVSEKKSFEDWWAEYVKEK